MFASQSKAKLRDELRMLGASKGKSETTTRFACLSFVKQRRNREQ